MIKKLLASFLALLAFSMAPSAALADGMVISQPDPYSDRWDYSDETDQQVFINYRKGLEKMIVGIKVDPGDKSAVWIFPVPADPSKVVIDVVDEMPRMSGEEVSAAAKMSLSNAKDFLFGTQIYPLLFRSHTTYYGGEDSMGGVMMANSLGGMKESVPQDVTVYESLDKEGMTTELITAKTANGLYDYFQKKGLKIENGMIPALDAYIGKDYSFVASWINGGDADNYGQAGAAVVDDWESGPQFSDIFPLSAPNEYQKRGDIKGVSLIFPTDDIYFPLLPTSVYESKIVPATIKIVGYVDPRIYQTIANFTEISYYTGAYFNGGQGKDAFFENTDSKNYTKIEINAPSKYLTEDLWIANRAPLKTVYSSFIGSHQFIVAAILLALFSIIASLFAGGLLLKKMRKQPGKLALLGISNCVSIIGLIAAALYIKNGEPVKKENNNLIEKLKQKGYFRKRRMARIYFIAAVAILPAITFGLPALSAILSFGYYDYDIPYQLMMMLGLAVLYLPLILAFLGWRASQIAPEDKPLFAELKANGYSTWTLASTGQNKLLFVVSFSALFLLISWIGTELLKLTV